MARSKKRQALIDGIAEEIRSGLQDKVGDDNEERRNRGMKLLKSVLGYISSREMKSFADYYHITIEEV